MERIARRHNQVTRGGGRPAAAAAVPSAAEPEATDAVEERLRSRQSALVSLSRRAVQAHSMQALYEDAVLLTSQTLGVDYAEILEPTGDSKALVLSAAIGFDQRLVGTEVVPAGHDSQVGFTWLNSSRPVVVDDLRTETRFVPASLLSEHGVVSGMIVTIELDGRPYGVLGVHTRARRRFDAGEADFLQTVSWILASALSRLLAEDSLQELNAQLEARVAARTEQLENAIRELEAFSYSVSHDLRAPLRSIAGFTRAALDDGGDELGTAGRSHLGRVSAAAARMGELIDDLLELARVSRTALRSHPVDLTAMAEQIEADLLGRDPDRRVQVDIQKGLVVQGDSHLLRVVLDNLLENAWKFTQRTAAATIEFGAYERGDTTVYFVKDNGAGFDMRYADRLFQPFQRLHSEAEFPGTGIGLATVRRIVERHRGRVWVEAAPGGGANFFFAMPPASSEDAEDE